MQNTATQILDIIRKNGQSTAGKLSDELELTKANIRSGAGKSFEGCELMHNRRDKRHIDKSLLSGPGSLSQALGITTDLTGTNLLGDHIWIEDHKIFVADEEIATGPRVGIDYADEDSTRPYRFIVDLKNPVR